MINKRLLRLSPPRERGIARVALGTLLILSASAAAYAQADATQIAEKQIENRAEYNRQMRTRTWSIYAQGGTSWATGVWYPSVNARSSYKLAPAAGVGLDYNIVPWARVGVEYLWSRYRGEQRLNALDPRVMPMKAYGNYLMNYHNVKLGGGLNIMELWPRRSAQWLNIYAGTGIGYMMASGNEHSIYLSSTETRGGITSPINSSATISNQMSILISGNVRTTNAHSSFRTAYIPLSLHAEADVTRRLSIGLKGEVDFLLNNKSIVPGNLILGMATVRYNLVPSRAQAVERYYTAEVDALNERINALQREAVELKTRAATERKQGEEERSELQARLDECLEKLVAMRQREHVVPFAHDSHRISTYEQERLRSFARSAQGKGLSLVAEASTPGSRSYNQKLSERRLQSVVSFLITEGFDQLQLNPQTAIGEQNNISTAEARRVTINVQE